LYPDKPIYDIPGLPFCTGRQLVQNLLQQIAPLGATFHFGQLVSSFERQPDGRLLVSTSGQKHFLAKTVFIAAGVGAFMPRTLKLEGIDQFEGKQLFYRNQDTHRLPGKDFVIAGDGEDALAAAIALSAEQADTSLGKTGMVTLLHRRDVFSASKETEQRFRAMVASGALHLCIGQATGFISSDGQLKALTVTTPSGTNSELPLDALVVLQGLSPKLGPVAKWSLDMERKQLRVDTEKFSTNERGVFAVGDINTYPGKKKLILCGFHEATLAAFAAAEIVFPGRATPLQYTTTSTQLHQILGV
jgi:thioredoxin reductase (NADPH)